jgi:thiamine-phosphate pyrophosphorylase
MICLVTDRRRRDVLDQVREAAASGIDLVQIRERDLGAAALAALVTDAVRATRGTRTRILVNDRFDVALASGADGVHLRADSIPAGAVRRLAPRPFLIGLSVHTAEEARAAGDEVDFLVAGTVFPTASKPDVDRFLGVDGLRSVCEGAMAPVLAIGGVTADRLDAIASAGGAGVAGIGWFDGAVPLKSIAEAVALRFDRSKAASYHRQVSAH